MTSSEYATHFPPVVGRQQLVCGAYQMQIAIVCSTELFFELHDPVKLLLLCKRTNGAFNVITHTRRHISARQLHFSLSEINKGESSQDVGDSGENTFCILPLCYMHIIKGVYFNMISCLQVGDSCMEHNNTASLCLWFGVFPSRCNSAICTVSYKVLLYMCGLVRVHKKA